jgi:hypothetical protein
MLVYVDVLLIQAAGQGYFLLNDRNISGGLEPGE